MDITSASRFNGYPELELVLCCARTDINSEISNRVKELVNKGINWSRVIEIAISSKIIPLLYRNLKLINPGELPDSVMDQLRKYYSDNLHENLHLFRELQSVLRLLASHDIPTICYKGPTFAIWLYGDLSLRHWGDLDILVHKKDVVKAKDLLISKGYKLEWPNFVLNGAQEAAHLEEKYNYSFVNEITGITIELHWGITPKYFSFPPRVEWLWERLVTQNFSGIEFLTFSPEVYLLILCMHSSNHCWMRLGWICDISELINKHADLDWDYIIQEASQFGVRRILLLGLLISHEFLGTKINKEILQMIDADARVRFLERQVASKFLKNDFIGSRALEIPIFHLRIRERFSDKVRYCICMSKPSSRDWATIPAIQPNSIIFFILRPFRLIIEHGVVPITRRLKNNVIN